jgi:hypothetical protein
VASVVLLTSQVHCLAAAGVAAEAPQGPGGTAGRGTAAQQDPCRHTQQHRCQCKANVIVTETAIAPCACSPTRCYPPGSGCSSRYCAMRDHRARSHTGLLDSTMSLWLACGLLGFAKLPQVDVTVTMTRPSSAIGCIAGSRLTLLSQCSLGGRHASNAVRSVVHQLCCQAGWEGVLGRWCQRQAHLQQQLPVRVNCPSHHQQPTQCLKLDFW